MKNLQVQTKANDVDEKGRVTVAVNRTGIEDAQGDISEPGSFDATLKTDINRMKWLYNHDITQLLGVPLEGAEKGGDIIMVGQLNMEKQLCRDVYTDYKLMAQYGRTLEHSVGVIAVRRDEKDSRRVLEWKMLEYSTLSFLGANPCTFLVDLKSATPNQVRGAVEFLQSALRQPEYSDKRLKNIDMELTMLLKSLNGGNVVSCPVCGHAYDYDQRETYKYSDAAIDHAKTVMECIGKGFEGVQTPKMNAKTQREVAQILDAIKALGIDLTEQSVDMVSEFVVCPHCFAKAYRAVLTMKKEEPESEEEEDGKPSEEETERGDGEEKPDEEEEDKKKSLASILGSLTTKL